MRGNRKEFQKRLARLEQKQRDQEFAELASVLAKDETLTSAEAEMVMERLLRFFQQEYDAGIPVEISLDKLPEPFRSDLREAIVRGPVQEEGSPGEMRA